MMNFIIGMIVIAAVGAAIIYLIKEKKKGVKCIGCPNASSCAGCCMADMNKLQDKM